MLRHLATLAALAALCASVAPAPARAQTPDLSQPAQIEAVFLAGLAAVDRGDPRQAVENFTAILSRDPTLTRVRLELGRAYFRAGEFSRARAEFLVALSGDLPAPVRRTVLQFIREIDARRGFEWSASVGLTEIGNTERYDTDALILDFGGARLPFDLDRDTDTAIGLTYGAEATWRGTRPFVQGAAGAGTLFASASVAGAEGPGRALDETALGLRAGIIGTTARSTAQLALEARTRTEAQRHLEDRFGAALIAERRFETGQTVFGSLRGATIDHRRDDTLDGTFWAASLGLQHPFSSRGAVGAELLAERTNVDNVLENARRYGLRVYGVIDIVDGYRVQPSLLWERRDFLTPSPLFTGDPDERSVALSLRVDKNDLFLPWGFSPFVELEARRTKSGIDAFSYRETGVTFGLESRF